MDVSPVVDLGRQSAKATVGEPLPVRASVFREGHDQLAAEVVATDPRGRTRDPVRMRPDGEAPNRYVAHVTPDVEGEWTFEIHSWSDPVATWEHDAGIKIPAGVDVELMFTEARLLLERVAAGTGKDALDKPSAAVVSGAIAAATDTERPAGARLAALQDPELEAVLLAHPLRELLTVTGPFRFRADRTRALFGSWYEFFPRSEGATRDEKTGKITSGNFRTATKRLDRVAEMGFDVLYLPPIHPIGEVNRKGPNNTLTPGPDDTGSPWAIGSKDGGHDAIHPELGTFEDFDAFVARARELDIEVALDLALQAAPDHPWVTTHPQFFTTRADGTIAYAENPPKKYQDIYPMNFDNDPAGICREVLRVVKLWMSHGVRIFRVDNPHTKPLAFWEWLLAEVRRTDPDVLFLSEAFTRPAMMHGLGAVGYHQSYTYFTWRTGKREIEDYLLEVSSESDHLMRPNFFVNTPDILHAYLQYGGPAAFKVRAALAATGSPELGRLRRLRAVRARRGEARVGGVPRLGEVPDPHPRLGEARRRGHHARALPDAAQRDPPPAPGAPAAAQRDDPLQRRRPRAGLLEEARRRRGHQRHQPRPARHARDDDPPRDAGPRPGVARLLRRPRRDHRRGLELDRAQLRPARPRLRTCPRDRRQEDPLTDHPTSSQMPTDATRATAVLNAEPDWFRTAVFYEVLVRSFRDSNGDGTGDFKGLIEKLDYLEWLGVDCLWVPPFFTSPLRDGGYDVADYNNILPECGTVEDFHEFLDACHQRGIRVIIDFVMNHTSDAHPWFQASRSDPEGPYGDFYVWSDTDELYQDARVIFVDTEPSNWTWDPVRQQYFWHRFFHHQPDLNFDNPKVHDAMLEAMAFWLDMGLDGFRLDAVPYLYERPGTNGENLPETHDFLKKCRRFVDENYPGRVLLCEANQWPADVVEYFGPEETEDGRWIGTECHMAFHFPVMPRIFMAVRRESRFPISEILEQTPSIPDGCQWGIFLRNHDELTLEMVTDEDRDYMWSEYAHDPRMKANIGIRRRLAPLLDNDVNRMELFTALLLSLPGSPVLYYGDEIGMGDNIWLGDRDGVRTPMQWTPDRNAGFSAATPGKLHLPAIQDPVYGYQSVNVEAQLENTSSLLHWTRRLVHARRRHPAFGLGDFVDLGGSNPSVLSYIREHRGDDDRDVILCVNNLSRFPQPVELDLRQWEGMVPVELLGGVPFPAVGELPYLLTLGGYGFLWLRLTEPTTAGVEGS